MLEQVLSHQSWSEAIQVLCQAPEELGVCVGKHPGGRYDCLFPEYALACPRHQFPDFPLARCDGRGLELATQRVNR